jgi:rhodanese-related sulfurtransferase
MQLKIMNKTFIFPKSGFLVILLIGTLQISFSQKVAELKPKAFKSKFERTANSVLLDVRSPEEFSKKYIDSAININYKSDDFEVQVEKLDKTKTYFVYCAGGFRSVRAIKIMQNKGFDKLYSLKGGFMKWDAIGLPTVQ